MRNISFDIAAIIVLFFLLVSVFIRKFTRGRSNHLFLLSIFTGMAASICEILAVFADAPEFENRVLTSIFHAAFLALHNAQPLIHLLFVISLLDIWGEVFKTKRRMMTLLITPYTILFLLLSTNVFTGWMFTVDPLYTHSPAFYAVYLCAVFYIVVDVAVITKYRKLVEWSKVIGLYAMAVLCTTAILIHLFMPSQLVECFAVALSLFVVSIAVQRPEDYLDTMTGLFKHSAYARDTKNAFKNKKHWHVVMLNIANYDTVLLMIGFEQGMELLKILSEKIRRLNKDLGSKADLYYLDRGRFRIVFPENERQLAESYATLINNDLKMKIKQNGIDINLTPMIVLARCPEEIESFKSIMAFGQDFHEKIPFTGRIMQAADVYHPDDFEVSNNIDKIIERALEKKSFCVYYQPIYSIPLGRFVSAEALLRLYDEEHGFISPEILVSAAEKSGAIHKIGEFVFEEVCKFVSSDDFKKLGLDYVEVNLSVAQCMNGDLADKVLHIMQQYNVPSTSINLEITETAASFSQRVMSENLNKLSRAGISFSLDDYGTGYSNMKRVISLPLKIVKLDKSFVDEQHNPKMWIFLQNTVKMLKDMNMEIVVEGIETQEMVAAFSDLKCDFIQGYYFSKAIPRDEFVKFITESNKKLEKKAE